MTRRDLSFAQKCVQSCHASIESAKKFLDKNEEHPHLVILEVPNKEEIIKLAEILDANKICFTFFRESDRNNEITALATEPIFGKKRKLFKKYKLLK